MRYRIVANLRGGGRIDLLSDDEGAVRAWWAKVKTMDLAGPMAASLTVESGSWDEKDIVLEMTGAT